MDANLQIFLDACSDAIIEDTRHGNWRDGDHDGEYLVSNEDILVEIEIDNYIYNGYITYGATLIESCDEVYRTIDASIVYLCIYDTEICNLRNNEHISFSINDEMISIIEKSYLKAING